MNSRSIQENHLEPLSSVGLKVCVYSGYSDSNIIIIIYLHREFLFMFSFLFITTIFMGGIVFHCMQRSQSKRVRQQLI